MRLIVDGAASGIENMRRDSAMLERVAGGAGSELRIYSFEPACLSLGRLQSSTDVDRRACARDRVDVVRRPTGGRAVLHEDDVTYAVACRTDDADLGGNVLDSCRRIHHALGVGLRRLGIGVSLNPPTLDERTAAGERALIADCFARPSSHELLDDRGRKLAGSAQMRQGAALLQHGSVLLGPSRTGLYLRETRPRSGSPGLRALAGSELNRGEVVAAIAAGFAVAIAPHRSEIWRPAVTGTRRLDAE